MEVSAKEINVYLEVGKKRSFAGAIEWPGWCRSGHDEASALEALLAYAPHYASALRLTGLEFQIPVDVPSFNVIERLAGDTTTDFGSPGKPPSSDTRPVDDAELQRFQKILEACWHAFDSAASAATGKELRKGPRGGGRDLESIIAHVLEAEIAYLGRIGWQFKQVKDADPNEEFGQVRKMVMESLAASARGEVPAVGPRGGVRWAARYFVRRVAWHVLDHAWEIEDRIL